MSNPDQLRALAAEADALVQRIDLIVPNGRDAHCAQLRAAALIDEAIGCLYRAAGVNIAALEAQLRELVQ